MDYAKMKSDLDTYAFAQCPAYEDDAAGFICQSNAIMRHLARKHNMYGTSDREHCLVDMVMDGVEDIKRKYLNLIYQDELKEEAKEAYWAAHCDANGAHSRNGGAHFLYLSKLLEKNAGGAGYTVGSTLTVADVLLFDVCDLHIRIFGDRFKEAYPLLAGHYQRVGAVPGIKAYLEGPLRMEKVNGNGLG